MSKLGFGNQGIKDGRNPYVVKNTYVKAMAELTSFSFTAKNLHDDAADSLAMMAGYIAERPKVISVARRPF
jgi:hypothetical protein